jgi:hypothetical protein
MRTKAEVLTDLRAMIRDVVNADASGGIRARMARAHGYVDGYMRALLELDVVTRAELLDLVARERERAAGPALRITEPVADGDGVATA